MTAVVAGDRVCGEKWKEKKEIERHNRMSEAERDRGMVMRSSGVFPSQMFCYLNIFYIFFISGRNVLKNNKSAWRERHFFLKAVSTGCIAAMFSCCLTRKIQFYFNQYSYVVYCLITTSNRNPPGFVWNATKAWMTTFVWMVFCPLKEDWNCWIADMLLSSHGLCRHGVHPRWTKLIFFSPFCLSVHTELAFHTLGLMVV